MSKSMSMLTPLLIFSLDDRRYALALDAVRRVVHAVDVTRLPQAPCIVMGVIDVAGVIVPVINMRRRLGLPERAPGLGDMLIIAQAGARSVALFVDSVHEVTSPVECDVTEAADVFPGLKGIVGVLRAGGDLALIEDLDAFLSPHEAAELDAALSAAHRASTEGP
jgi:purine-binding chemotaxis protein CheW